MKKEYALLSGVLAAIAVIIITNKMKPDQPEQPDQPVKEEQAATPVSETKPPAKDPEPAAAPVSTLPPDYDHTVPPTNFPAATLPPGFVPEQIPKTSVEASYYSMVLQLLNEMGPKAEEGARQLMESGDDSSWLLGVYMLADLGALKAEDIDAMSERNPADIWNLTAWLDENNSYDTAVLVQSTLPESACTIDAMQQILADNRLGENGRRILLNEITSQLSDQEAATFLSDISSDTKMGYSPRLKATLMLRDKSSSFSDYRDDIDALYQESLKSGDAMWESGLKQIKDRLQGPEVIMSKPPIIDKNMLSLATAIPHPYNIENLTLQLEYALDRDDSYFHQNAGAALDQTIKDLSNRPLTTNEQLSIRRLKALAGRVNERIDPLGQPPAHYIPLPVPAVDPASN